MERKSSEALAPGEAGAVAHLYEEGLAALRRHDAVSAVERLEGVVRRVPGFAPAHAALAACFKQLFLDERARQSARRALEFSEGLCAEEGLLVKARYQEAHADWARAIDSWRELRGRFPDNVEYGTALVEAQVAAGRVREAQETLAALRRLPAGKDVRLALAAATVMTALSDFASSRRLAGEAVARARQEGQGLLAAAALVLEAFAARNQGEPGQAVALLEEAERLYLAGGARGGAARAMLVRTFALIDQGRLRAAEGIISMALRVARELEGSSLLGEILLSAGGLSCQRGELDEALRRAREGLALNLRLGMLADANICTGLLGRVHRHRGELEQARRLLEEAARAARERFEDDYIEAWMRYELGCLALDRGEPERARPPLERALALRQARGLRAFIAESELALARLALEEGQPREALALAERALETHVALRNPDQEGLAHAVRARALLARGAHLQARQALLCARVLAGHGEDVQIAAEVTLTEARLALLAGSPEAREKVRRPLLELVLRAAQGRMKRVELEARLALAELARAADGAAAEAGLQPVREEALRLGFLGLARRAGATALH